MLAVIPAGIWAIVSFLASMGAWEGARALLRGTTGRLIGEGGKQALKAAGEKLAAGAAGQTMAKGLGKVPWLAKHLPSIEQIPSSAVGAAGGMVGLIGGMKAAEYTHELMNPEPSGAVMDADNIPAMEEIKRQASLRAALQQYTGASAADIERMLGGGGVR